MIIFFSNFFILFYMKYQLDFKVLNSHVGKRIYFFKKNHNNRGFLGYNIYKKGGCYYAKYCIDKN